MHDPFIRLAEQRLVAVTLRGLVGTAAQLSRSMGEPAAAPATREQVAERAKEYVGAHGWPGLRRLAEEIGCSRSKMGRVIARSPWLKEQQEHAAKARKRRPLQLSDRDLATTPADAAGHRELSRLAEEEQRRQEVSRLIEDQRRDDLESNRRPGRRAAPGRTAGR